MFHSFPFLEPIYVFCIVWYRNGSNYTEEEKKRKKEIVFLLGYAECLMYEDSHILRVINKSCSFFLLLIGTDLVLEFFYRHENWM